MKRMLLMFCALLALLPLTAQGESAEAIVTAQYPDAQVIASAQTADEAFFVLADADGAHRLCGAALTDGAWSLWLDSVDAIRPSGLGDGWNSWKYHDVTLTLTADALSIGYRTYGVPAWQYDFAKDAAGTWRFVRLRTLQGSFVDELTFAEGCVNQTSTKTYADGGMRVKVTPPCPMPWLTDCETLAGFDASAFPMDLGWLSREELARVAAELLPGYTLLDGKFSSRAVTFLMENPSGEVVFLGGVHEKGEWVWTESDPLPENVWCDSFHAGDGCLLIGYELPGEPDEWGDLPWVEYSIDLQDDGRWLVTGLFCYDIYDNVSFQPEGLYISMSGWVYGASTLERDITKIVWADYPVSLAEILPTCDPTWGVVGEESLPLYEDADGSVLLAEYFIATPVQVLDTEGELAQVRIADTDVTGWMPVGGLWLGADQLFEDEEENVEGEWYTYLCTAEYNAPLAVLTDGARLYTAPQEDAPAVEWEGSDVLLMADLGNGWYHVRNVDEMDCAYVRAGDFVSSFATE